MSSLTIKILPALADNYIFLAAANGKTAVVDPGDAAPVLNALADDAAVEAVLITHRHADHIGGVGEIARRFPAAKIVAPEECGIPGASPCAEGGRVSLLDGALNLRILATPGHTRDHVAFYDEGGGVLFCGDTLFACGCGRMFEGTAAQMQNSLARLAALPPATKVYCGHEYTAANIRFALAAEPENSALRQRRRRCDSLLADGAPTIPFTIGEELATNPFVRLQTAAVIAAARKHGAADESAVSVFAALRRWKDNF
ncbi:MAG: hydroxyacylglutathione hydrolase [Gammaproteobacteria bacterium]